MVYNSNYKSQPSFGFGRAKRPCCEKGIRTFPYSLLSSSSSSSFPIPFPFPSHFRIAVVTISPPSIPACQRYLCLHQRNAFA
jgi:hypothetical protein